MAEFQTLAEYLGTDRPESPVESDPYESLTGKQFAEAVLNSLEFRRYIVSMLTLGEMPAAVLCRLMDYGWGKPVERVEHSGEVGITRIERVVIQVEDHDEEPRAKHRVTH